jgi:hypothetical protein
MKKAEQKPAPLPILSRYTSTLPVKLTEEEAKERAKALAQLCQDITAEEARATDVKAQLKARLTQLEGRRSELSIIVAREEEMRPIACEVIADYENNKAIILRTDTGVILSVRPLTDTERQSRLPLEPEPAPGTKPEDGPVIDAEVPPEPEKKPARKRTRK